MDGIQVIDPHSNLSMRQRFAQRWLCPCRRKSTAGRSVEKAATANVRCRHEVSAGEADVCIAGNLSSTANVLRAGLRVIGLQPGCKTLSSIFLMLPQYAGPALGFADCGVVPQPTAARLADIAIASADTGGPLPAKSRAWRCCHFQAKAAPVTNVANVAAGDRGSFASDAPQLLVDGELRFDAAFVPGRRAKSA